MFEGYFKPRFCSFNLSIIEDGYIYKRNNEKIHPTLLSICYFAIIIFLSHHEKKYNKSRSKDAVILAIHVNLEKKNVMKIMNNPKVADTQIAQIWNNESIPRKADIHRCVWSGGPRPASFIFMRSSQVSLASKLVVFLKLEM